jgi:hypothetical protein
MIAAKITIDDNIMLVVLNTASTFSSIIMTIGIVDPKNRTIV